MSVFIFTVICICKTNQLMRLLSLTGQMQLSYEHCMPKKEDDMSAKRSVVVFRHGRSVPVTIDTGTPMFAEQVNVHPGGRPSSVNFGHPIREIPEGKDVFTKDKLVQAGAHRYGLQRSWYMQL